MDGERRWAAHHPGRLAEELDLDAAPGQLTAT
jgi:hypothetical protein